MNRIAILLNTWQTNDFRSANVQALKSLPGMTYFEEYIIGMDIPGVSNWKNEALFWKNLISLAQKNDYIILVKALNAPVVASILANMLVNIITSRFDYLYFDGSEFGFGNNLRFEIIRGDAVERLTAAGVQLFADGSIDTFGKCDAACYFPSHEDCVAYYGGFSDTVYSYPMIINLEGVSACNIQCKMCRFHGQQSRTYVKPSVPFMDRELFIKIVDEVAGYPRKPYMEMCLRGEELLAKDFVWKVKYMKERGLHVFLVTNGQLLIRDISREILAAGIDHIVLSAEGATEATFEGIMQRGSHAVWSANIAALIDEKKKLGAPTWITMKLVMQPDNIGEIDTFVREWKSKPVQGVVLQNFLKLDEAGYHHSLFTPRPMPFRIPCRQFFLNAAITTRGWVSPCSAHDQEHEENSIGDVSRDSLLDIWRGPKSREFQKAMLEGRYTDVPFCAQCGADTCKSIVMARWSEGDWLKTVYHSVVGYQRLK